jgi:hypothetical protein
VAVVGLVGIRLGGSAILTIIQVTNTLFKIIQRTLTKGLAEGEAGGDNGDDGAATRGRTMSSSPRAAVGSGGGSSALRHVSRAAGG